MTTLYTARPGTLLLSFFRKRSTLSLGSVRNLSSSLQIRHPVLGPTFIQCRRALEFQVPSRNISMTWSLRSTTNQEGMHPEAETCIAEEDLDQTKPYVIYEGALTNQMKHVKIFSLMTSGMGLVMQPVLLSSSDTPLAATIAVLGMIGFFTYVTPFLIHQLAKKYVTEIIYDPQTEVYTAATYSFFLRRRETTFKKDDVTVPDAPGPLTSILVDSKDGKKTGLFVALESFIYPVHYGKMMGYDKPLDLHLTVENVKAVVKEKQKKRLEEDADSSKR